MTPRLAVVVALLSCCSWIVAGVHNLKEVFELEEKIIQDASSELGPRVIGGRPANDKEFPWMVSLHYQGRFVCSSFLITPSTVMTAAHCVVFRKEGAEPADKYNGYVGNINRDGPDTEIQFSKIVAHSNYGEGTEYDIALMTTKGPVQLSDSVKPICLPTQGSNSEDSMAQAMGWGVHQKNGRDSSPELLTLAQHVPTYKRCYRVYNRLGIPVTKRHVCAGGDRDKGICYGDSGGPLVNLGSSRPTAIGVASFGSYLGCAVRGVPAVYTCTECYLDWIQENMGDDASNVCYA